MEPPEWVDDSHLIFLMYNTNSSQSDTLQNQICKEQGKDSFYSDFVLQSIIKIVGTLLGMAGGWDGLTESGR